MKCLAILLKQMNKAEIAEWLEKHCRAKYYISNYTINEDLTVDVDGSFFLEAGILTQLPFKFGIITGSFSCEHNCLYSLYNCPNKVGINFWCGNNQLKSLEGCPKIIKGRFICDDNLKEAKEYQVYLMMQKLMK